MQLTWIALETTRYLIETTAISSSHTQKLVGLRPVIIASPSRYVLNVFSKQAHCRSAMKSLNYMLLQRVTRWWVSLIHLLCFTHQADLALLDTAEEFHFIANEFRINDHLNSNFFYWIGQVDRFQLSVLHSGKNAVLCAFHSSLCLCVFLFSLFGLL